MITEENCPIRTIFFRDHGNPGMSVRGGILGAMSNDIPPALSDAARFQAGMVARRQALRSGMSSNAIASKVKRGRWRKIYPGVYATFSGPVGRDAGSSTR
jgi:hypothetical protein